MVTQRVVITGMGCVSPLGPYVSSLVKGIEEGRSAIQRMPGWNEFKGLRSLIAAPAELVNEKDIPRRSRRSMGRMSIFAAQAAEQAVNDAGLEEAVCLPSTGCIVGSTMGSTASIFTMFQKLMPEKNLANLTSMEFFQCMSHSAAMNIAHHLGITGIVLAPAAACASGLQAIGEGYEMIRSGRQTIVLCGGAEELHPSATGAFDVLYAASTKYNDKPARSPRPFDRDRDGLVCGEGCGILVLENEEHARKRKARIHAEITGYHSCSSGEHICQSSRSALAACMRQALKNAEIEPGQIDYVNAHATGTVHGDQMEAEAIAEVLGPDIPVSGLKGYLGHTLGAAGALELIVSLKMMKEDTIYPTRNLEHVDPACGGIRHVLEPQPGKIRFLLKNAFAFGGINATLICCKYD